MNGTAQDARALLTERRRRLMQRHAASESEERALLESATPDWVDQAADTEAANLLARFSERERRELGEIEAALARIEAGTYGTCVSCGDPIGAKRLRAMPEARLCLSCSAA